MNNPLTPTNADLRSYTWLKLDYARLFASEFFAMANDSEFRAAFILWCKSMQQLPAGSLPDNDLALAGWTGKSPKQWARIKKIALHGWVLASDGRLYHPVLAEVVNEILRKEDSKNVVAPKILEKHIQQHFYSNLSNYLPLAKKVNVYFKPGHLPDGFVVLPNTENPIPVEIKLNLFNLAAERQLRRYMHEYSSHVGVAVAPRFYDQSAQDIIYVQVAKDEVSIQ